MAKVRQYFHDRTILFFLSVNAFLTLATSLSVILRITSGSVDDYIRSYRQNLGLDAFQSGTTKDMLAFIVFVFLIFALQLILSKKIYHIRRDGSIIIIIMTTMTLGFALLVSNALLSVS